MSTGSSIQDYLEEIGKKKTIWNLSGEQRDHISPGQALPKCLILISSFTGHKKSACPSAVGPPQWERGSDTCMCANVCVRDAFKDVDTKSMRVSDWTGLRVRLREYGNACVRSGQADGGYTTTERLRWTEKYCCIKKKKIGGEAKMRSSRNRTTFWTYGSPTMESKWMSRGKFTVYL